MRREVKWLYEVLTKVMDKIELVDNEIKKDKKKKEEMWEVKGWLWK